MDLTKNPEPNMAIRSLLGLNFGTAKKGGTILESLRLDALRN